MFSYYAQFFWECFETNFRKTHSREINLNGGAWKARCPHVEEWNRLFSLSIYKI